MSLLDRLRPQPRWKHADPAVRAAAVRDLDPAEQEVLLSLARGDADPAVRQLAVARLLDLSTLGIVAREDSDETVRGEAVRALAAWAAAAGPEKAGAAVRELAAAGAVRELAALGRSGAPEPACRAALEALADPKVLAQVARQAEHVSIRLEALARVSDPAELLAVATRSEHRDVATAALDRIDGREALEAAAVRARNKHVARRAQAKLRMIQEQEELAERRRAVCASLERQTGTDQAEALAAAVEVAEREWAALAAPEATNGEAGALAQRFAAAIGAAQDALVRLEAERGEAERQARERERERALRLAACEAVTALDGPDALDRLAEARAGWEGMPPSAFLDEAERDRLQAQFASACVACEARHARLETEARRHEQFARLAADLAEAANLEDRREARARVRALEHEWAGLAAAGPPPEELRARAAEAEARLEAREAAEREERARHERGNQQRLTALCERLEQLAARPELTLRDAERGLREARMALEAPGRLPSKRIEEELLERLRKAQTALYPRVHELREIERWQQWANAGVQEELVGRLEALRAEPDPEKAAVALRGIMARWREVAAAPHESGDALRERFKAAHDDVRARCDAWFAGIAEERARHLAQKRALCEQAEALASSTDWIRTADAIKQLQAEWQKVGPVPNRQAKIIWKRFRTACDTFFTRRKEDLAARKAAWAVNLEKKEALCARAEALAESADWEATAAELRRIQAEWKTIGPVKKSRSEAIWQRFRGACDRFFERYKHRDQIELAGRIAGREAICAELEALASAAPGASPASDASGTAGETGSPAELPGAAGEGISTEPGGAEIGPGAAEGAPATAAPERVGDHVREIKQRWERAVPLHALPRTVAAALSDRFNAALARVVAAWPDRFTGTELDPGRNLKAMERLCEKVEQIVGARTQDEPAGASPAEILARRWREALAANTMGARVDDEAAWRAAADDVKQAQSAWRRLPVVPGEAGHTLARRFRAACDRFFELQRRRGAGTSSRAPQTTR